MIGNRIVIVMVLLLVGMGLTGCASLPKNPSAFNYKDGYRSSEKRSQALNVVKAANAKWLSDSNHQPQASSLKEEGSQTGLGMFVFNSLVFGMQSTAIPHFFVGKEATHELNSGILVWMPINMASTAEEAIQKYVEISEGAMEKALAETTYPLFVEKRYLKDGNIFTKLSIDSVEEIPEDQRPSCLEYSVEVSPSFYRNDETRRPAYSCIENGVETAKQETMKKYQGSLKAKRIKAPDFIDSEEVWAIQSTAYHSMGAVISVVHYQQYRGPLFLIPHYDLYLNMSKHLPEWIYIYMSPHQDRIHSSAINYTKGPLVQLSKNDTSEDIFLKADYPVVFHGGRELFFVTPWSDKSKN